MTDDGIAHGTYGGYQVCRRAGAPCDPCRVANNAYQREYRRRHPEKLAAGVVVQNARTRALRRLAQAHRAEFRVLYDAELQALRDSGA